MTDKVRGSDQLKLNCSSFCALTQEELMQVSGGWHGVFPFPFPLPYPLPFPKGIPGPLPFEPLPQLNLGLYSK